MQASFSYLVKHRLKATHPQKYRDVNILTKDLFTLKSFYDSKVPSHPTQEDSWRFQAALDAMSEKKRSMTKIQKPSATVSKCEDISEDDMEPPQPKKAAVDYEVDTSSTPTVPYPPVPYQATYFGYGQYGPHPTLYPRYPYMQPPVMPFSNGPAYTSPFDWTAYSQHGMMQHMYSSSTISQPTMPQLASSWREQPPLPPTPSPVSPRLPPGTPPHDSDASDS